MVFLNACQCAKAFGVYPATIKNAIKRGDITSPDGTQVHTDIPSNKAFLWKYVTKNKIDPLTVFSNAEPPTYILPKKKPKVKNGVKIPDELKKTPGPKMDKAMRESLQEATLRKVQAEADLKEEQLETQRIKNKKLNAESIDKVEALRNFDNFAKTVIDVFKDSVSPATGEQLARCFQKFSEDDFRTQVNMIAAEYGKIVQSNIDEVFGFLKSSKERLDDSQ